MSIIIYIGTVIPSKHQCGKVQYETHVGAWTRDSYPSPLVRFLRVLGIEPVVCPPRRPDKKGYVERVIRTLKHENLYIQKPANEEEISACLQDYQHFYNHERAHQGLSCKNRPPMVAHVDLPALKTLPTRLNPDAWVNMYHGEVYKRQVTSNGSISIDNHYYHLGREHALKEPVFIWMPLSKCSISQLGISNCHRNPYTDYIIV